LITSLEDLTTEYEKEGWFKVVQDRVVSIPGFLPFPEVGALYYFKPQRMPATAIGISPEKSFILETTIEFEGTEDDLKNIGQKIVELRLDAANAISDKLDLIRLRSASPDDKAVISAAEASYKTLRKTYDDHYSELLNEIKKTSGILIYRWTTETSAGANASLGSIFKGKSSFKDNFNGFGLVAGIRMATLFVGPDIKNAWPQLDTSSHHKDRHKLTTFVMQAQHILYSSEHDMERQIQAKLDASYQQLASLPESIKVIDKIEIEAVLSKLSSLSNMGMVKTPKREVLVPIDWGQQGLQERMGKDGWLTFYSVDTKLSDLKDMVEPLGGK